MKEIQNNLREEFPILHQEVNKKPLIYFDNAATSQKPKEVIKAIVDYYQNINSNVHRGVHTLAQHATEEFEATRKKVQAFINAQSQREIIFTRGTTEAINLVASGFMETFVNLGDNIVVSELEHHSNFVPWQMGCQKRGAEFRVAKVNEEGELSLESIQKMVNEKTKLIAVSHVSNVLGIINPIEEIIEFAKSRNIPVLLDGAQAIGHIPVDVQKLDCDFYAFSGHKMYAPMGIGVLYGKEKMLEKLPPYQGGGEMISSVSIEKTTFNELPYKFEAGTPNVGDTLGLKAAIEFIERYSLQTLMKLEHELVTYALNRFEKEKDVRVLAPLVEKRTGAISFLMDGIHFYDAGVIFDKMGIALRTGTHCAEPLMKALQLQGTIRISLAPYNTFEEIDAFFEAMTKVKQIFS